jgi:hypothetical protein
MKFTLKSLLVGVSVFIHSVTAQVPPCNLAQLAGDSDLFSISGGGGVYEPGSTQEISWSRPPGAPVRRIRQNVTIVDTTLDTTFTPLNITGVPVEFLTNETSTQMNGNISLVLPDSIPDGTDYVFRVTIRSRGALCYLDTGNFTVETATPPTECTPGAMICSDDLSGFQQCVETDASATAFTYGNVIPCAATTACHQLTNSTIACSTPSGPVDQCTLGSSQCTADNSTQTCITNTTTNTTVWGTAVACPSGCDATTGLCVSPVDQCTLGSSQCASDNSTQTCITDTTTNTTIWDTPVACPFGCDPTTGLCVTPVDQCTLGTSQCLTDSSSQSCITDPTSNTTVWSAAVNCPLGCDSTTGLCVNPVNECTEGTSQCVDVNSSRQCVLNDATNTTVWTTAVPCSTGFTCNNSTGLCEQTTTDQCTLGQFQCVTTTSNQQCITDTTTNTTVWSAATDCPAGTTCNGATGNCTSSSPTTGCIPYSQICLSDTTFDTCSENDQGVWTLGGVTSNCPEGTVCTVYINNTINCVANTTTTTTMRRRSKYDRRSN